MTAVVGCFMITLALFQVQIVTTKAPAWVWVGVGELWLGITLLYYWLILGLHVFPFSIAHTLTGLYFIFESSSHSRRLF